MARLSFFERMRIPAYDDPEQCSMAAVEIDYEKCTACGRCTKACPADALYIEGKGKDKVLKMQPHLPQCAACNDCMAICEQDAIKAVKTYDFVYRYKVLGREGLEEPRRF